MAHYAYIRVSTDKQDVESQKHTILEYAQKQKIVIDEIISVEMSSRQNLHKRKIDILKEKCKSGDTLYTVELSRLSRGMVEGINIIHDLTEAGVKVVFINQPELSTLGSHSKLLQAIYSFLSETERKYISMRTKSALHALKASGKKLGRPKGSRNRNGSKLDRFKNQITEYRRIGLSMTNILKIINNQSEQSIGYTTLRYYIQSGKL